MIRFLLVFVLLVGFSQAILPQGPCCSRHYANSGFCETTDQSCCEKAGGFFVQGRNKCSGQLNDVGVDLYCAEWNEQNGTSEEPVCCEYDQLTGDVACTQNEVCSPTPGFPKLLLEKGGCNLCPEFPPPEAICRCQDQCCETAINNRYVVFIGLIVGLSSFVLGCCGMVIIMAARRRDEEEGTSASGRNSKQD